MSILQTTELKKYYGAKPNITRALDGVTLSIEKGEFVAIVGTSGSGKSTLLNMIGGERKGMPQYIAIDLKSFYASVECVERGLDPLTTNLVVADESRTEKTWIL